MRYVGIDLSIRSTGIAIIDSDRQLVGIGTVDSSSDEWDCDTVRFAHIAARIMSNIGDIEDTIVGIEGYAFAARGKVSRVHELGGVVKHELFRSGLPGIFVFAPASIKKFATSNGKAKKDKIAVSVFRKWGIELRNNDETDAYIIARMLHAYHENPDDLLLYERDTIDLLRRKPVYQRFC